MIVLAGEEKPKSKSQLDGAAAGEGEGMHRCRSPTLRSSYRGLRPYESSLHMFGSIMPWCMLLAGGRGNGECTPRCGFFGRLAIYTYRSMLCHGGAIIVSPYTISELYRRKEPD